MEYKKFLAIVSLLTMIGAVFGLAGCSAPTYSGKEVQTQEQLDALVAQAKQEAYNEGKQSVDITADNAEVVAEVKDEFAQTLQEEKVRDQQLIEQLKAEAEQAKADAEAAKAAVAVSDAATGTTEVRVEGDSWFAKTSSNMLEIGESISSLTSYIGKGDMLALNDGVFTNNKGSNDYEQELRFGNIVTNVYEDSDDVVADFVKITDGSNFATYTLTFTSDAESDISSNILKDFRNKKISILGRDYSIVKATTDATGKKSELTLMAGSVRDVLGQGVTKTYTIDGKDYEVELVYVGDTDCKFKVNGVSTDLMEESESTTVAGIEVGVKDIMEEEAGEIQPDQVEFYLGADKLVLSDDNIEVAGGNDLKVGDNSMDNVEVTITGTGSATSQKISSISLAYTADDDYFIAKDKMLSNYMEEPESLIGFDITYKGLSVSPTEKIELSGSNDEQYVLDFTVDSGDVSLPLAWNTGVSNKLVLGEENKQLVLNPTSAVVEKDEYFILTPGVIGKDTKTQVLQYKNADDNGTSSPVIRFRNLATGETIERTFDVLTNTASLKLGGTDYTVYANSSVASDDYNITVRTASGLNTGKIVTAYGALISLSGSLDSSANVTMSVTEVDADMVESATSTLGFLINRDLSTADNIADVQYDNAVALKQTEDSDVYLGYTAYGAKLVKTTESGSPDSFSIEWPKFQIGPQVFVINK